MAKYPGSFIINEVGTRKELADIYGVSERTIYRWLNRAGKESGLSPKPKQRKPRLSTLENFKGTRKELARKYGVSERTAYRWLEKAKKQGASITPRAKNSKYPGAQVIQNILQNEAVTNKEIAERYDVPVNTVRSWIRRAKMELPSLVPDLRKTGQYKLRRKGGFSRYEYIGDEQAFEQDFEDAYNPETMEEPDFDNGYDFIPDYEESDEEPFEVDYESEWEWNDDYEDTFSEHEWSNLSELTQQLLKDFDWLPENSDYRYFRDFTPYKMARYIDAYLRFQWGEDEHQFYDESTHTWMYKPDDPNVFSPGYIKYMDIWGEQFTDWLSWQTDNE